MDSSVRFRCAVSIMRNLTYILLFLAFPSIVQPSFQSSKGQSESQDIKSIVISYLSTIRRDPKIANQTIQQIEELGDAGIDALLELRSEPSYEYECRNVLSQLGGRILPKLIAIMESGKQPDNKAAAETLATIDDPRKFDPLFRALESDDSELVAGAVYAIASSKWPDGRLPSVSEITIKLLRHDSEYVAKTAASIILRYGVIDFLLVELTDPASWLSTGDYALEISKNLEYSYFDLIKLLDVLEKNDWIADSIRRNIIVKNALKRRLQLDISWSSEELREILRRSKSYDSFLARDFNTSLATRIIETRAFELIPDLEQGINERLIESDHQSEALLIALASLSPARACSAALEYSSGNSGKEDLELLTKLEEPNVASMLAESIREESNPEKWFPTAEVLARILKIKTPIEIRLFLREMNVPELEVDGVLLAREQLVETEQQQASQFPLGVPRDYMMLSILPNPNAQADPERLLLYQDYLVSSFSLFTASRNNPEEAIKAAVRIASKADREKSPRSANIPMLIRARLADTFFNATFKEPSPYLEKLVSDRKQNSKRTIPVLLARLGSGYDVICALAAKELGELHATEALPALRKQLGRNDHYSKRDILGAIVAIEGDQSALELWKQSAGWGSAARRYLYFPLARSGPEGEKIVLDEFDKWLPDGKDAYHAGLALLSSGKPSAAIAVARSLSAHSHLFKNKGYDVMFNLTPLLPARCQTPECIDPFAALAADEEFQAWLVEGLESNPGDFADQVIITALRRGAKASYFKEYLEKRPFQGVETLVHAAYLSQNRKSWDLETLIQTGSKEAMEVIRQLLEQKNENGGSQRVFEDIVNALYKTPHQEGWEYLPELYARLGDRDRFRAINRIPRSKAHPAVLKYLLPLLDMEPVEAKNKILGEDKYDFAAAAAAALERLDAVEALESIYSRWDKPVIRTSSVMLLARHATPETVDRLMEMVRKRDYAAWRRIELALATVAIKYPDQLARLAHDPDVEVRRKIAAVFSRQAGPTADRILCELAVDTNPFVRSEAIAFMDRGPESAFSDTVLAALSDSSGLVRTEAIRIAGILRIEKAIPSLSSLAAQNKRDEAEAAAFALGKISTKEAKEALQISITQNPSNITAIRQLGILKIDTAVPLLEKSVESSDLKIRHAAMQSLAAIGNAKAIEILINAFLNLSEYFRNHEVVKKTSTVIDRENETQTKAKTLGNAASSLENKRPSLYWPPAKLLFSEQHKIPFAEKGTFRFSYRKTQHQDSVVWCKFQPMKTSEDESWTIYLADSKDEGQTWTEPEKLSTFTENLSHFQYVPDNKGRRHLVFARGRRLFVGSWQEDGRYDEKPIPLGSEDSEMVQFSILERKDGSYLLFVAVGEPAPNDSLNDISRLMVLSSTDLVSWTNPAVITEEGLYYFTVNAIPATETRDGRVLVGVGNSLYVSGKSPEEWETLWRGNNEILGYANGISCLLTTEDGQVYLGYRSSKWGYSDLYLTSTMDFKTWTKPIFTTIHDAIGTAVSSEAGPQLLIEEPNGDISVLHYLSSEAGGSGEIPAGSVVRSTLDLNALQRDSDSDGLVDAVEERLLLDPTDPDSDHDGVPDSEDLNPLAPKHQVEEHELIRQAALERLNYWHVRKPDMSKPASMMVVVTDGDERQEFESYPGVILNLSSKERAEYWTRFGRFGLSTMEVIITDYKEGSSKAVVHTFTGHEAFSITLVKLQNEWLVTRMQATFRVY